MLAPIVKAELSGSKGFLVFTHSGGVKSALMLFAFKGDTDEQKRASVVDEIENGKLLKFFETMGGLATGDVVDGALEEMGNPTDFVTIFEKSLH